MLAKPCGGILDEEFQPALKIVINRHLNRLLSGLVISQIVDDEHQQPHDYQHLHWRETHLTPPGDVVADKVARPEQQLQQRVGHGPRVHAPQFHESQPHALPGDASQSGTLRASGTIVALKLLATVVALVRGTVARVAEWLALPLAIMLQSLLYSHDCSVIFSQNYTKNLTSLNF